MSRLEFLKKDLLLSLFSFGFLILMVPLVTYFYFASALETPDKIMNKNDTGILLLDHNNKPFFSFYSAKNRNVIPLSQMPKYTQEAVISSEDKDFYSHPGFSVGAILRAFVTDILHQKTLYGGSTITQQLVKNALLSQKKSFMRKFQEIILANEIERRYSKDKILEMYLNSVYFGDGSFGIEEASQRDFGKHASDLTLGESALLSGILSAPSTFSPVSGDKEGAYKRQKIVLSEMAAQKYISQRQMDNALKQPIILAQVSDSMNTVAPHFALMVRDQLIRKYGEEVVARSGFRVKTTLDIDWQRITEEEVAKQVKILASDNVSNGAAVVEDPKNGEIRALVGSKDWNDPNFGKFNVALANRQPGSSFKPIVYVAALKEHLITAATQLKDNPITYDLHPGTYSPHDYDGKYRGNVTVRRALSNSLNIPAVQVLSMLGIPTAVNEGKELGLTTLSDPSNYGLSLVLGAAEVKLLEMTNVYATFANQGLKNDPTLITQIQDKNDSTIYKYTPKQERVLDPEYPFIISSILSDNATRAEEFGNTLDISRPAAVKTGTTNDFKDAWTLGYTPSLAIGVWVGNNDNQVMDNIAGSLGAAPIWRHLMETFLAKTPVEKFEKPLGIVAINTCGASATESGRLEFFALGTQPKCNFIPTPFVQNSAPSPTTSVATPTMSQASSPTPFPTPTPTPVILFPLGKLKINR